MARVLQKKLNCFLKSCGFPGTQPPSLDVGIQCNVGKKKLEMDMSNADTYYVCTEIMSIKNQF